MRRNNPKHRGQTHTVPEYEVSCVNHPDQTTVVSGHYNAKHAARQHRAVHRCWYEDMNISPVEERW